MAGIPPLVGFFSKQFVLYSALQNGYYFISILGIIVSVISASYYLKIIKILFTESTESELDHSEATLNNPLIENASFKEELINKIGTTVEDLTLASTKTRAGTLADDNSENIIITNTHSYLISILTLFILLFFIKPTIILNSTQLLSLSLFFV
jgi:NADH-ubiquinone oxidoreductase chain 2